jgi:hypothetical protein
MAEVVALRPDPPPDPHQSLFMDDEHLHVLLPGGGQLVADPTFGDDVWELVGHASWKAKAGAQTSLDFTKLAPRWRAAAKHLALFQLRPHLALDRAPDIPMAQTWAHSQEAVQPATAQGNLKMLHHALGTLDRSNITVFDDDTRVRVALLLVTPQNKAVTRDGATLSATTGRGRAQQLITLWQITHITESIGLLGTAAPFGGRESSQLYTRRSPRNSVRPDDNVGHMLGFTAWIIDNIAEDIVSTVEWWATNTEPEPMTKQDRYEAMLDLVCRTAADNDGAVPASRNANGGLTLAHGPLGRLLGVYDVDDAFEAGRWTMSQLKDTVTLSTRVSPCPIRITELDSGTGRTPWTNRLLPTQTELDLWQRYLVYACMYYLSATLMLRDSQLSTLPLDPLEIEQVQRPDGTSYDKYTLHAYRTKNRHSPVPTTVTVNARVARIISLLRRLQYALGYEPALSPTGQPFLFDQRLAVPYGKNAHGAARDGLYLDMGFAKLMRLAAAHLHERGVIERNLDGVTVNARQVRITCAQAYATREHGAALSAAFGQWDTKNVAAGYVGDVYKRLITPIDPD